MHKHKKILKHLLELVLVKPFVTGKSIVPETSNIVAAIKIKYVLSIIL